MISIWASHSSTEQNLVDKVESELNGGGGGVDLMHYRKLLIDESGQPYAQDQLEQNEEIGRLISDIGDSRGGYSVE